MTLGGSRRGRRRVSSGSAGLGAIVAAALAFVPVRPGRSSSATTPSQVRLQVDAQGRALVSFRSAGVAKSLVAWGAVDARAPSRARPQVAFSIRSGGGIGSDTCRPYAGPPLAWLVLACTAADGTHWALQAWQRMLPNYGVAATGDQGGVGAPALHWSGPIAKLEVWTDWSYRRFHHLYGRLTYRGQGVYGFRSTPIRSSARRLRAKRLRRHLRLGLRAGLAA